MSILKINREVEEISAEKETIMKRSEALRLTDPVRHPSLNLDLFKYPFSMTREPFLWRRWWGGYLRPPFKI